jgi:hypothetical protein
MAGSHISKALQTMSPAADVGGVAQHIRSASKATGVSFDYLMAQANKESGFVSEAKSQVSSAAGLFQFTKGTWLQLIKLHGPAHGMGDLAGQIERNGRGEYVVADAEARARILGMRRDPALSSLIAGEYARDNKHWLEKSLGRKVGSTELYLAHFLGPGGAVKLLKARAENPEQSAAELVPEAAAKNQTMFYDQEHGAHSVAMLYDRVKQVMENPTHPPRHKAPPADLAIAALKYGNLPWVEAAKPDTDRMLSSLHWSVQAYTEAAKSAAHISAPMPVLGAPPESKSDDADPGTSTINVMLKDLFG